jgi:Na+/proline symporter
MGSCNDHSMTPFLILSIFLIYTIVLFTITWITSRKADHQTYFVGNKISPWYVVAYGMIGASLSGVTFMSVPGWVKDTQFSYMVMVLGYMAGYAVIATVLLPLYYRMNLTSIYTYLEHRFGFWTYKTGAGFFLLSRTIGASLRMFLVVNVLHVFVFQAWGIPFWVSVLIFITLIILYTFKGGIKTIVWTDTLQTTFMLLAVALTIVFIGNNMHLGLGELIRQVAHSDSSRIIITDWKAKDYFLKHLLGGAFITIAMTGLDQEMMQKNLSCRNIREAQINMFTFSGALAVVNVLFLFLGSVLLIYSTTHSVQVASTDDLFPTIAMKYLSPVAGLVFLIGLISAAYPSADGALTSLTTSFCIDFLGFNKIQDKTDRQKRMIRYMVHISVAVVFLLMIILFKAVNNKAVIDKIFTLAGYTYGPLLGLYSFGLLTKRKVYDRFVPVIAIVSPLVCMLISYKSAQWLHGYRFGFELLLLNGLITFLGLLGISKRNH